MTEDLADSMVAAALREPESKNLIKLYLETWPVKSVK